MDRKQLLIGGEWRDAEGRKTQPVLNPATEEVIAEVGSASKNDVDAAVAAARAALNGPWRKMSARERGRLLWQVGERLIAQIDEVSRLETLHNGKPITESRHIEIPMAAECLQYFAGWADKIHGDTVPVKGNGFVYTLREPLGRRRRDRALEFSTAPRDVESRAGARRRQHRDPQAGQSDTTHRAGVRADRARGRLAARRPQRRHRQRLDGRTGTRRTPWRKQDRLHRGHVDRPRRHADRRRDRETPDPRARRQIPEHRLRGRGPRRRREGRDRRHLLRQGRGVRGRLAAAGRPLDQGCVHRQGRRTHEEDGAGRSDGSRRPGSERSHRRRSSSGS